MTEQNNTPEFQEVDPRDAARAQQVDLILETAASQDDIQDRVITVTSFLDEIYTDAMKGELRARDGSVYDLRGMQEQVDRLHEELNRPKGERDPLTRVTRTTGIRKGFRRLMDDVNTAGPLLEVMARDKYERERQQVRANKLGAASTQSYAAHPPTSPTNTHLIQMPDWSAQKPKYTTSQNAREKALGLTRITRAKP